MSRTSCKVGEGIWRNEVALLLLHNGFAHVLQLLSRPILIELVKLVMFLSNGYLFNRVWLARPVS